MKKIVPALIAILLIVLIAAGYMGSKVLDRFSYSEEMADLEAYFHIENADDVAIILQNEMLSEKAKYWDGMCYFSLDTIQTYFNERFYFDREEGLLLYTTATEIISSPVGTEIYTINQEEKQMEHIISRIEGEELYVSAEYIKNYTNYSYELFENPLRLQVDTMWEEQETAVIKKSTQVRYQGGVKSDILTEIMKGESVYVLEPMETWTKVKTRNGFIGYVENKKLEQYAAENPIPVTDYVAPEYTSIKKDEPVNLVWHAVAGVAGNDTFLPLYANTKGVNVVSPTWFYINDDQGNIVSFASEQYVEQAHQKGLEVWAMVDNFTNAQISTFQVLSKTSTRTNLIDQLVEQTLAYGIDGINVDFENLSVETGEPFIQFLRELSVACRKNHIVLSVDNYVPIGNTNHYRRKEQGIVADYVIIMGYDEHYKGSAQAGSVASIDYVEKGIVNTLEEVPAEKIINALPFYTRIWESTGADVDSQAVGMELANEYIANHGLTPQWDETTCQNYAEYQKGDTLYQIWMEDAESIRVKLNVMKAHGITGVAGWKMGFETPDIWDVIAEFLNQ